jgi:hypothetical protein
MHEQRELADYDYSSNWTRTDAAPWRTHSCVPRPHSCGRLALVSALPKVEGVAAAFKAWKAIRNKDVAQELQKGSIESDIS